jgi:rhodanese-related sulfurtransferase
MLWSLHLQSSLSQLYLEMEATMLNTIDRDELNSRIQSAHPPVLLEALPERYYVQKHLPGALLFPHDQVEQNAASVVPDKSTEIIVYCASRTCQNSHIAAHHLMRLGYTNVTVYPGGKQDWEEGSMPFESGADVEATV